MKRNIAQRSNEQRLLRPRLEVKEEEGFDRSDVKKALLESLYELRKEERRKELEKELERSKNNVINKLTQKYQRRNNGEKSRCSSKDKKENDGFELKERKEEIRIEDHTTKSKNLLERKEKIEIRKPEIKEKGTAKSLKAENKDAALVKSKEKTKSVEAVGEQREETSKIIPEETNTIIEKVEHKNLKNGLDIETLPSTRDFVRFMSLDYSDDPEDIPKELRHFLRFRNCNGQSRTNEWQNRKLGEKREEMELECV